MGLQITLAKGSAFNKIGSSILFVVESLVEPHVVPTSKYKE